MKGSFSVIEKRWSWPTLLLYVLLAVLMTLCARKSVQAKLKDKRIKIGKREIPKKYLYYFVIYLVFIIFSCFRVVTQTIGRSRYINIHEIF